MALAVVVHSPFAAYTRGQVIRDAEAVKAVLAGDHASSVHRIDLPEPAAPARPTVEDAVAAGVAAAEAALHPSA